MLPECNKNAARMLPECYQNAARMGPPERNQKPQCNQNAARMQPECCQNAARILATSIAYGCYIRRAAINWNYITVYQTYNSIFMRCGSTCLIASEQDAFLTFVVVFLLSCFGLTNLLAAWLTDVICKWHRIATSSVSSLCLVDWRHLQMPENC